MSSPLCSPVRIAATYDFGTGGAPFECDPPHPGQALVGLALRVGDWVDQVAPIFAELHEDGSLGPEQIGPAHGGSGGAPLTLRLPYGYVVTGMQTRSGDFVDGIRLLGARWEGTSLGDMAWTPWVVGAKRGGVERHERRAEPAGRAVIVGIAGRSGWYVDSLTLIQAELQPFPSLMPSASSTTRRLRAVPPLYAR
jgi:hypothetical protein